MTPPLLRPREISTKRGNSAAFLHDPPPRGTFLSPTAAAEVLHCEPTGTTRRLAIDDMIQSKHVGVCHHSRPNKLLCLERKIPIPEAWGLIGRPSSTRRNDASGNWNLNSAALSSSLKKKAKSPLHLRLSDHSLANSYLIYSTQQCGCELRSTRIYRSSKRC